MTCELCGHVFSQKHRVIPALWGGTYEPENVVRLCPNHHAAIHCIMSWYYQGAESKKAEKRVLIYADDRPLWLFWLDRVRPVVQKRMDDEGRWKPHYQPPFSFPAGKGDQKKDWIERRRRLIRDDDNKYHVNWDVDYAQTCFGDRLAEMNPEDIRRHPFFAKLERENPQRFAMVLGYLIGSRVFPPGDGYPASFMAE